jgi:aminomethyltransferase
VYGEVLDSEAISVTETADLRRTPLYPLHLAHHGRMVPFAGYAMPVDYSGGGVMAEHRHTRTAASLFDVSHMGVVEVRGDGAVDALERVTPAAVRELKPGRVRYGFLTNQAGGVIDDIQITNHGTHLTLVLNAARKDVDTAHLEATLPPGATVTPRPDLGLMALQGPTAVATLAEFVPAVADLSFNDAAAIELDGAAIHVSRTGYTGEDGVELTVRDEDMCRIAELLLARDGVRFAGLGARDSLRLEAGLCLYGNDLTEDITPVEAALAWAIGKRRRAEGGFLGASAIQAQLGDGPARLRVGLQPVGRRPVRAGATLRDAGGAEVGFVSSGGYGPTVGRPIAMGYVRPDLTEPGTALGAHTAGRSQPEEVLVAALPFVPHRYSKR